MKKKLLNSMIILLLILAGSLNLGAQITTPTAISDIFPDKILAEEIAKELKLKVSDKVKQTDLNAITSLNFPKEAADPSGIEYLQGLIYFDCHYNTKVVKLDLSKLVNLYSCKISSFSSYNLTEVDLSGANNLTIFECEYCDALEKLILPKSGTKGLTIKCRRNKALTTLDVSKCANLVRIDCSRNKIKKLDLSNLTELEVANVSSNEMEELKVSGCVKLTSLDCEYNYIKSIDVSGLQSLNYFNCSGCRISSLEVKNLLKLTELYCVYNSMNHLIVSGTPNLLLISAGRSETMTFSGCTLLSDMYLTIDGPELDLTGCPNVTRVFCYGGGLKSLNVSNCKKLQELQCSDNNLKFSTLPLLDIKDFRYSWQKTIPGGTIPYNDIVDLSSERFVKKNNKTYTTTYKWVEVDKWGYYMGDITSGIKVIGEGKFTFDSQLAGRKLHCYMYNDVFTGLELKYEVTITQGTVPVTGVSLDQRSVELIPEEELQLTATITPTDAVDKTVTWSSVNPSFVSVSNTGKIKGVATGNGKVVVKTADGNFTDTCFVKIYTVAPDTIHVNSISLNYKSVTLNVDSTLHLIAKVMPSNASIPYWRWTSTNSSVATVDHEGNVKAVAAGNTLIIATTYDKDMSDTCIVKVENLIPVSSVSLNYPTIETNINKTIQLKATVNPANASNKKIIWTSDKPAIAKVDSVGNVTALSIGTATITATSASGNKKATCTVTVAQEPIVTPDTSTPGKTGYGGFFDFLLSIPANTPFEGSFIIRFPQGMGLSEEYTKIPGELEGRIQLSFNYMGENSWQIQFTLKSSLKNTLKSSYVKILNVGYTVSPVMSSGTYNTDVYNLNLKLTNGTNIVQDHIEIPLNIVRTPTGIEDISAEVIKMYPNPAKEQVTIDNGLSAIEKVMIMDLGGRVYYQSQPNVVNYQLSVANLPKGIYIVNVKSGGKEFSKKLIKQ